MRLCFLAPLLLIVSPEGSFRVLRRPLPLRLQSLGQQPCLGHVRPHLAQSVRLIGGALIATGLEPSDPPVEVREAAGVRGHAGLDGLGEPIQFRKVVQFERAFSMGEYLARGCRGGVPSGNPGEAVPERLLSEGEPQLLSADAPGGEMCIRDSAWPWRWPLRCPSPSSPPQRTPPGA